MKSVFTFALGAAAGAAAAHFLDPESGRRRRSQMRSTASTTASTVQSQAHSAAEKAKDVAGSVTPSGTPQEPADVAAADNVAETPAPQPRFLAAGHFHRA
jgi:gas vesicle protein